MSVERQLESYKLLLKSAENRIKQLEEENKELKIELEERYRAQRDRDSSIDCK